MLKAVLLFIAGLLVGANAVYFLMTRPDRALRDASPPSAVAASMPDAGEPSRTAPSERATPPPSTAAKPTSVPSTAVTAPAATSALPAPSGLIVPVQGMQHAQLNDTFSEARSEGRAHEALDIMAPRGTPVVAVADGTVEKLFLSRYGGLTIYQFEPSGRYAYYYAHLDRYARGLAEGQAIRQGEVIGYVGSSGNADPSAPHLHFAVFLLGPERRWWKGTAINPYPLFKRP